MDSHPKDAVCVADLESAVIEAAVAFRRAETAKWVESEVGSAESAQNAKAAASASYITLVNAVDALLKSREKETP